MTSDTNVEKYKIIKKKCIRKIMKKEKIFEIKFTSEINKIIF